MNQLDLFSTTELSDLELPACHLCKLDLQCQSPKMPVHGEGRRRVLVVGEAPGPSEDALGRSFVGKAGQLLRATLRELDVDLDRDCWATHSVICRPPSPQLPAKAIEHCRPNLSRTIRELDPDVVVLLGGSPIESVIGPLWGGPLDAVSRWVGWRIPVGGRWLCPTWNPNCMISAKYGLIDRALGLWFRRHLAAVFGLSGRPETNWSGITPDSVRRVYGQSEASEAISSFVGEIPVAFDLETDRIKPDYPDSRIVCVSLSDGDRTIAFPWHGQAIQAFERFLASRTPKVAANLSFEHRWLKGRVRNWHWDTVQAAHVLDGRGGITGLAFQAFVRLGVGDYSSHLSEMLKSMQPGGNEPNQIDKIDLDELLVYCGLDSLLTIKVMKSQQGELA